MKSDGTLPPASDLVDEAMENADLNDIVKALIRALPDSVIDAAVKTDDVLVRTINDLDLREVLANLDDQDDLNRQVSAEALMRLVTQSNADAIDQYRAQAEDAALARAALEESLAEQESALDALADRQAELEAELARLEELERARRAAEERRRREAAAREAAAEQARITELRLKASA